MNHKQQAKKLRKKLNESEALFNAGMGELTFANQQNAHLLSVLNELQALSKDPIITKIIELEKERYQLNKIIHAKMLFDV